MAENPSLFEPGRIPTQTALLSAGRSDLGNAIKQHGALCEEETAPSAPAAGSCATAGRQKI